MSPCHFTRTLSLVFALCPLLFSTSTARADSNCVTGLTVPLDSNAELGVVTQVVNGHVAALILDTDRNGTADVTFSLPQPVWDAADYFLSRSGEFVLAVACPNIPTCLANGGPLAGNPTTIGLLRVPATGSALELVHTDCLGGGLLNGNGRWYEAGLCNAPFPGQPCGADANFALGATGCNKIFVARTDIGGNNVLRIYDLNNTTPDTTDGRGAVQLNAGIQDTTLAIDRGGNFIVAQSGIIAGTTSYDYNIIDVCPGSADFGQRIVGGLAPYVQIQGSRGIPSAQVTSCASGTLAVQPRVGNSNLGPQLALALCCAGAPAPMGRCCNFTTGGCSITTLANCPDATSTWTLGGNCNTACPAPAPVLALSASGPSSVVAGAPVTFTFICSNNGFATANGVSVRLLLSTSFVTIESVNAGGTINQGQINWSVGSLAAGAQSQPLTVTLRPTCLATLQAFNVQAQAFAANAPTVSSQPPISVTTSLGSSAAITATLTSVTNDPQPLLPGSVITHTITLTNPLAEPRWQTNFSIFFADFAALFDQVIDAGGGTFTIGGFSVGWVGDLAPSSTTTIIFTTRISSCPPPLVRSTQLGGGQPIFILTCGSVLATISNTTVFTVAQPVAASLTLTPLPGQTVNAPGLGTDSSVIARAGAPIEFTLGIQNQTSSPLNGFAQIVFPDGLTVADPPFGAPVPGLSWDNAARTLTFSGSILANSATSFAFTTAVENSVRCFIALNITAGFDQCRFNALTTRVYRVAAPPQGAHLEGIDYIDGLWTFEPGIDTSLQALLCFNFGGTGSGSIARAPNGDLFLAQPFFRFNPVTVEYQSLTSPDGIDELAFNGTDNSLVLLSSRRISRYDLATGATTTILDDPANFFSKPTVGSDGRIVFLSASGLSIIDPRPPVVLPLTPADIVPISLPNVTFASGQTAAPPYGTGTVTTDGAGDYIITAFVPVAGSSATTQFKVVAGTLAATVVIPAISGPPEVLPLTTSPVPQLCSAVGTNGELYLGTVLLGELARVDPSANPPVETFFTNAFPGCLDMVHTQPGIVAAGCAADFNTDGVLNADDLADFITGYFNVPSDPATDFNGDGVINADDLGDFITAYFNGC